MKIASILLKNIGLVLFSFIFLIALSPDVSAQSSNTIAQSFKADTSQKDIVDGALVSTKGTDNSVELATPETAKRLVGVVDGNPLVSLSENGQEIDVVFSGATSVLVSDINGPIKSGDKITTSPIAGVGMKATADSQIVGTAQDSFRSTTSRTITDRSGKQHIVHLDYVRAQVGIASYQPSGSNLLPPFVQNAANAIAGRPVALVRVLICSLLLLLGLITASVLIFASTRSAMTALGRNPLAAHAIRQGLYQAIVISLVAVGVALLASYLILTV